MAKTWLSNLEQTVKTDKKKAAHRAAPNLSLIHIFLIIALHSFTSPYWPEMPVLSALKEMDTVLFTSVALAVLALIRVDGEQIFLSLIHICTQEAEKRHISRGKSR